MVDTIINMKETYKNNTVLIEGVEFFPENAAIIKAHGIALLSKPKEYLTTETTNPFYHGPKRSECLLVRFRKEKTYDDHFIDIYKCLTHDKETCRCGMEWVYYLEGHYND